MRRFLRAQINGIGVTDEWLNLPAGVAIDPKLMVEVGLVEGEAVQVVNLTTGARWETYAVSGSDAGFSVSADSGRLASVGDRCVVSAFEWTDEQPVAPVIYMDADNWIADREWMGPGFPK